VSHVEPINSEIEFSYRNTQFVICSGTDSRLSFIGGALSSVGNWINVPTNSNDS